MLHKIAVLSALVLLTFSNSSFSAVGSEKEKSTDKTVTVVVENRKGKELPADVDPFLASVVGGLETVQKTSGEVGIIDCGCSYISHTRGGERTNLGDKKAWASYDIHIGKYFDENSRIDFVYINEGRPTNNHRDGFAVQAVREVDVSKNLRLEFGLGPYFNMDTTSPTHNIRNQIDEKDLGVLGTIAALYSLNQFSPGLHLRLEYNHVSVPREFDTDSFMIGFGKDFETHPNSEGDNKVAVMWSHFKTNHHITHSADGVQVEVKHKLTDNTDISASYMREGKDNLVDRQGVAVQYWYSQEFPKKWVVSVGAGPYIAENKLSPNKGNFNGLISMELKKEVTKDTNVFVRLTRIADFAGSNDRDDFAIGVARHF